MQRLEKLLELLKQDPADSFLLHALAMEYMGQGQGAKAKEIFENLLQNDPDYIGSYYQLGKLIEQEEQYSEAAQWYEKGMEVAQKLKNAKAYNELRSALEEITED